MPAAMGDDLFGQYQVEDPLVAVHLPMEIQHRNIEGFRLWRLARELEWIILPPATTYGLDGRERFLFVLRYGDTLIGLFASPFQELQKIGNPALTNAFYQYMRDRVAYAEI